MSDDRLSQIATLWSVVRRAHADVTVEVQSAQQQLLDRYGGAVQRYLIGACRDQDAAADLYQEFALKFLRGDLCAADPDRGRFRCFLKSILFRMVATHFRGRRRLPGQVDDAVQQAADATPQRNADRNESPGDKLAEEDAAFVNSWRDELLSRAWRQLEQIETDSGKPHYTVLRLRVDSPELSSKELAEQLGAALGKPVAAGTLRVMLHRARDVFADMLLDDVAATLEVADENALEEELIELRLLDYCRPALKRRLR